MDLDSALAAVHERYRPANKVIAKRDWWRVHNVADGSDTTIVDIYDEISWFGISADEFRQAMSDISTGTIEVHLASPGGDVFDGLAIFATLRQHPATVHTVVDSLAASIASVIMMAGDQRSITPNGMVMIHEGWGLCIGPAEEHAAMAKLLDKVSGNIATVYEERATGDTTADEWRALMLAETWFTADEAKAAGLVDAVVTPATADPDGSAADAFDLSVFTATATPKPDPIPEPSTNGGIVPADFLKAIREAVPT